MPTLMLMARDFCGILTTHEHLAVNMPTLRLMAGDIYGIGESCTSKLRTSLLSQKGKRRTCDREEGRGVGGRRNEGQSRGVAGRGGAHEAGLQAALHRRQRVAEHARRRQVKRAGARRGPYRGRRKTVSAPGPTAAGEAAMPPPPCQPPLWPCQDHIISTLQPTTTHNAQQMHVHITCRLVVVTLNPCLHVKSSSPSQVRGEALPYVLKSTQPTQLSPTPMPHIRTSGIFTWPQSPDAM